MFKLYLFFVEFYERNIIYSSRVSPGFDLVTKLLTNINIKEVFFPPLSAFPGTQDAISLLSGQSSSAMGFGGNSSSYMHRNDNLS